MVSQILFLSQPRTACHLLERMLVSQQPDVNKLAHPFASARASQRRLLQDQTSGEPSVEVVSALRLAWEEGFETWKEAVKDAEATHKVLFTHTHCNNITSPEIAYQVITSQEPPQDLPTAWALQPHDKTTSISILPDSFFLHPTTLPLFTIRHPALTVPSIYRAMRNPTFPAPSPAAVKFSANLAWSRKLYDWYLSHGIEPLVADADDYMTRPGYVAALCSAIGLDPKRVSVSWPKATEEERSRMPQHEIHIMRTLLESEGVIDGLDATSLRLEDERRSWVDEFGEEAAAFLAELVDGVMPDYEYLHERRFRMEGPP